MTDPAGAGIYANIIWGYIDGIHGAPYIAAPWIRHAEGRHSEQPLGRSVTVFRTVGKVSICGYRCYMFIWYIWLVNMFNMILGGI